jgi:hypothetical protein
MARSLAPSIAEKQSLHNNLLDTLAPLAHDPPMKSKPSPMRCTVPGCSRTDLIVSVSLCRGHYQRLRYQGAPGPAAFAPRNKIVLRRKEA